MGGNDVLYCISKDVSADINIFLDPEFRDNVKTRQIEHECVINCEVMIRDNIGNVHDGLTVKTPFLDEQGNVAGHIGVARDITERKSLEKQLRKQAEYAELLFSTVPSAVFSVDRYGKIIRWNKIAEEITGYAAAEVMGKECSTVLHGVVGIIAGCVARLLTRS